MKADMAQEAVDMYIKADRCVYVCTIYMYIIIHSVVHLMCTAMRTKPWPNQLQLHSVSFYELQLSDTLLCSYIIIMYMLYYNIHTVRSYNIIDI